MENSGWSSFIIPVWSIASPTGDRQDASGGRNSGYRWRASTILTICSFESFSGEILVSMPAKLRNFLALVSPTRWKCLLPMNFSMVFSSVSLIIRLNASTSTP